MKKKYLLISPDGSQLFHSLETEITLARMLSDSALSKMKEFFESAEPGDYYATEKRMVLVVCVR